MEQELRKTLFPLRKKLVGDRLELIHENSHFKKRDKAYLSSEELSQKNSFSNSQELENRAEENLTYLNFSHHQISKFYEEALLSSRVAFQKIFEETIKKEESAHHIYFVREYSLLLSSLRLLLFNEEEIEEEEEIQNENQSSSPNSKLSIQQSGEKKDEAIQIVNNIDQIFQLINILLSKLSNEKTSLMINQIAPLLSSSHSLPFSKQKTLITESQFEETKNTPKQSGNSLLFSFITILSLSIFLFFFDLFRGIQKSILQSKGA